jgi:septal ring factor EnvC (AmiA/AmiB activator)
MNTVAHTEEDATSSKDFKVMAKELEKHSAALQQLRAQREEEETELEALRKELEHLPVQARKLAMDVEALTKQSADLKARLKQLQPQVPRPSNRTSLVTCRAELTSVFSCCPQAQLTEEEEESLAALEKQITKGERAVKKIDEEAAEVKAEVTELEEAIAAAGGDKLKRQKAKFEAATKAVDDLRRRINRAKVRLTSGKKESTQARVRS